MSRLEKLEAAIVDAVECSVDRGLTLSTQRECRHEAQCLRDLLTEERSRIARAASKGAKEKRD